MKFIDERRQRLQTLKKIRPQYAELFDFYGHLYDYFADRGEAFLAITPAGSVAEERRSQGLPAVTGDDLLLDDVRLTSFLAGLIGLMREHGSQGRDDLDTLLAALTEGRLNAAGLLRACLQRQRDQFAEVTRQAGVLPVLAEYVLQAALSYALQRVREEDPPGEAEGWEHGSCPYCGGLPAMAELHGEEGKRRLHCATCASTWNFPRLRCTFCNNSDPNSLEYFTAEGEEAYRVDVCRVCSCYLKTVDSRQAGADLPMDLEDVATVHLDLLAQREGFTRGKEGKD